MDNKVVLEPPDLNQCQAEIRTFHPFVMGGPVHTRTRCKSKPVWIATENNPQRDGLCGSMALCEDCLKELIKKYGPDYVTLTPVKDGKVLPS